MSAPTATMSAMTDDAAMRELLAPLWSRNRDKILAGSSGSARRRGCPDAHPTEEIRADLHALIGALGTYR